MFNLGDIVEEVSTQRRGKIDNMSLNHDHTGAVTSVNYLRVIFTDGETPLYLMVQNPDEIRLVARPDGDPLPGFYPARGIME